MRASLLICFVSWEMAARPGNGGRRHHRPSAGGRHLWREPVRTENNINEQQQRPPALFVKNTEQQHLRVAY